MSQHPIWSCAPPAPGSSSLCRVASPGPSRRMTSSQGSPTSAFVGYYKSCDIITFSNASEAKSNLNRMVAVTFESESFQRSWGRAIIIKNLFQIFREVACVNILAGNRVIFNFKVGLAARMTGSLVQVRGGPGEGRSPPLPAGALGPPARLPQGGLLPHPRGPRVEGRRESGKFLFNPWQPLPL